MNARLPAPAAADLTPVELVQQWTPLLRSIAWKHGCELDDLKQEAWLLAATMRGGDDLAPRWIAAVKTKARGLGGRREPVGDVLAKVSGWVLGCGDASDPADVLEAGRALKKRLADGRELTETELAQVTTQAIEQPVTAREIAAVTGRSERTGRRIKAKQREVARVQCGFWDDGDPEVTT